MPVKKLDVRPRASTRYFKLVKAFPLRPLQADTDLNAAVDMVDRLLAQGALDADEQSYLEVLSDLIEQYEKEQHPMPPVSGAEMLRFLISQRDATLAQVSAATKVATSTLSSILNGRRKLTLAHIRAVAPFFGVAPEVFID